MLAVGLALRSAALFGAMTVALRFGFRDGRAPDAELGAFICVTAAALIATIGGLLDQEGTQLRLRDTAFFALAGLIAPGASQLLFTRAGREAGPSRTSVVVGTAPLFAAAMAIVLLDEPIEAPLVIGGILVVAAGLILVSEPSRPEHVRLGGIAIAFAATLLFTSRANLVRWYSGETSSGSLNGAAVAMTAGALGTLLFLVATRGRQLSTDARRIAWRPFAVAGVFFGLSYVCLSRRLLPRARDGRLSPRRDGVPLGRDALGTALQAHGGGGWAARGRGDPRRRRRHPHLRFPLG